MNKEKFTVLNKHIKYCNNFFKEEFLLNLLEKLNQESWKVHRSTSQGGWFFNFTLTDNKNYKKEISFLSKTLKKKILRVYVNGQCFSQHGDWHQDDGKETYLVGLTPDWNCEMGGATEFLGNDHTSISVYPVFNRLVIFDASLNHRALPQFNLNSFRMTLAIKTSD
tara:strand:- start:791 stop:1288 length:498 start_codon:yes stop_codon:yes gene_type:complete